MMSLASGLQAGENLDSLFVEARNAAMNTTSRDLAIEMCQHALSVSPDHHDFRILLGRCYSWNGDYSLAESELTQVVAAVDSYQDARNALLDVYIWSEQDDKALELLAASIEKYPTEIPYRVKQLQLHTKHERTTEAQDVVEQILAIDSTQNDALAYLDQMKPKEVETVTKDVTPKNPTRSTTLRFAYNRLAETATAWQALVLESSMDPWHWISLEHKETFSFGPVIFKLNYANRFQDTATQLEIESYPTIRKGTYLYTGVGLSKSDLFPSFRMGVEIFQALPREFEVSLGFRYLEVPEKKIPIYVGSLGKYWQSFWISAKTYISPSNSSLSKSWVLGVRKYLLKPADFFEVSIGSGVSPDINLGGEEVNFLGSRSLGISLKKEVQTHYDAYIGLRLSNLEVRRDAYRGDTGIEIALTRNF